MHALLQKKTITNINLDFIFMILECIHKASNRVKSDPDVFCLQVNLQYITKRGEGDGGMGGGGMRVLIM